MAKGIKAASQELHSVTFRLGAEEFGVDIMNVQEIIRIPEITRVPRSPEYMAGISNLRGNVLPIIDTRRRFSMSPVEHNERSRIMVVELAGQTDGLVVDEVSEVLRVDRLSVEDPPTVARGETADEQYLEGVVNLQEGRRLIMLLNLDEI